MVDEAEKPEESGAWADHLWGPRDPDALDLRPELLTRPRRPDAATPDLEATTTPPDGDSEGVDPAGWEVRTSAAIRKIEVSLRKEMEASETRLARALDATRAEIAAQFAEALERLVAPRPEPDPLPPRGPSLEEFTAALDASFGGSIGRLTDELAASSSMLLGDVEAKLAKFASMQAEAQVQQHARLDAAMLEVADRLGRQLDGARDVGQREAVAQIAVGVDRLVAAHTAVAEAPAPAAAADVNALAETLQAALAASLGEATTRLSDELATNATMVLGDIEAALAKAAGERTDAAIRHIADRISQDLEGVRDAMGSDDAARTEAWEERLVKTEAVVESRAARLDATLADLSRQVAALGATIELDRFELPERIGQAVAEGGEKHLVLLEQALGALSKAVADERHSSAAMVRGSLAATDQAQREAYQGLEQVLGAVLKSAQRGAIGAEAAGAEARELRVEIQARLPRRPPPGDDPASHGDESERTPPQRNPDAWDDSYSPPGDNPYQAHPHRLRCPPDVEGDG